MAWLVLGVGAMDRFGLSRVARILWPYVALWLVIAGGLVGFASYELSHQRESALAAGRAEADNLSRFAAEQMASMLDGIDRTLTLFKIVHERKYAAEPMSALGEAMKPMQGTDVERRVNLFDRDGRLVASTDEDIAPGGVTIADRPYFRQARVRDDLPLHIGDAVVGRVSKTMIVPVAKRLQTPAGEFDGVVVTAIDPHRVIYLFRALRVGERSSIGIAHREGPVLAWTHSARTEAGTVAPTSIVEVVQAEHVVAISGVIGTELIAFASLSEDELLSGYRRSLWATLAFVLVTLAATTLPIVWVGSRAWNEIHRRRHLELRYASVHQQARTDPLTGLANRTGFDEARRDAYERLKHEGAPFAIAFVDIDHFKKLNDTLGHEAGDDALRRVAETLTSGVRQTDAVGRLGGDEFAILMSGVTASMMRRRFDPIKLDLDAMVAREGWPISFSIGVVAYESATPRARDAVILADRLMYDAKGAGRDAIRYAVYRDGKLTPENDPAAEVAA